jgi:hypothetical protein
VAWLGRFGLDLAAALGATGIFVAAAAVGASQTRQTTEIVAPGPSPIARTPVARPAATASTVRPERSIAGKVIEVRPDALVVRSLRGQEWRVTAAPGALIRLNGKAARLESLQVDDQLVILGQAQLRGGFLAHAITARRK